MSIFSDMAALRRELRDYVDASIARLFVFTFTSNSSPLGNKDEVQKDDYPVDGEKNQAQRPGRRIEPFGFRSRPPSKVRQLSLRFGSSNVFFIGVASDGGYGPTDLNAGETAIYSVEVERGMHLTSDGDNKLASKSGKTVQINGNDYFLPKWNQFFDDLTTFLSAVRVATSAAQIATAAGVFQDSSNSPWKSTKAKNG